MTVLNIGEEAINSEEIALKVQSDISFLADRLKLLELQRNPNPAVVQTYRNMLESRQAVLTWLLQDNKKVSNG